MLKHYFVSLVLMFGLITPIVLLAGEHTTDSLETVKQNLAAKKAVLLDVREQNEWKKGHLKDAKLLPLSQLEEGLKPGELDKLAPKGTIIYTHCLSGARCVEAAKILREAGRDVRPLKAGYPALVKAGFPPAERK
ncbi:MAG: rhodanese-like domain-containing protein [Planctomycetales bacterium]